MPPPIPKRLPRDFLVYCGNAGAAVTLEVHLDLQCPFSKRGWGNVKQLKDRYSADQLRIVFYPFTLFTHQWAWIAHHSATTVGLLKGRDAFFSIVDKAFEEQEKFQHAAGRDKTPADVEAVFAEWAAGVGCDKAEFAAAFESDEGYLAPKEAQRVGILRQVWSTPTFFLNGVEADKMGSGKSPDEWAEVLDGMIGTAGGAGGE
uniref:Thioredoxin-like fold domain-containing protein n=1 Tax=Bicosoecida sp. CB-2014 TaxID=1486930 RepID=A0A7S1G5G6_9STRA|mmetsp:Transcript_16237/g.56719  ORF Transcript_16237/g.56719 Transcript_16237/m.56719 type:complete len:203 (+) Transcript_16237:48-656(+)